MSKISRAFNQIRHSPTALYLLGGLTCYILAANSTRSAYYSSYKNYELQREAEMAKFIRLHREYETEEQHQH